MLVRLKSAIHSHIPSYIHTYSHTYIHTDTYIHTYIYIYIQEPDYTYRLFCCLVEQVAAASFALFFGCFSIMILTTKGVYLRPKDNTLPQKSMETSKSRL